MIEKTITKNKSGWILQEYLNIPESEISKYRNVTGAYAIVKVGEKYLIGYNDWRKQWEFPAGGIEPGETARQAAVRELYEETHQSKVNLEFKGLFRVTDAHGKQKYQAVFLGEKESLEPFAYAEGDEMSQIRLWDLKEDIGYVDEVDVAVIKIVEYLQDPCGTSSLPYWKAKTLKTPDQIKIIHCRDWKGQYSEYQRFFRVKHSLNDLSPIDFDYDTISIDHQTKQLAEMINASYSEENIVVSEDDIMQWKKHETFREELCIYINADGGKPAASGIAEYDSVCREGIIEWVQVLPEYRGKGYGKKIVTVLLNKLKKMGAEFATVSGNLDNRSNPLELYKKCGFTGNDVWYICRTS